MTAKSFDALQIPAEMRKSMIMKEAEKKLADAALSARPRVNNLNTLERECARFGLPLSLALHGTETYRTLRWLLA